MPYGGPGPPLMACSLSKPRWSVLCRLRAGSRPAAWPAARHHCGRATGSAFETGCRVENNGVAHPDAKEHYEILHPIDWQGRLYLEPTPSHPHDHAHTSRTPRQPCSGRSAAEERSTTSTRTALTLQPLILQHNGSTWHPHPVALPGASRSPCLPQERS